MKGLVAGLSVARGSECEGSGEGAVGVASWLPHAPQNRAPTDTVAPQRGHFTSSGVPHCSQNRAAEGLSNLHDAQVIGLRNPRAKPIATSLVIIVPANRVGLCASLRGFRNLQCPETTRPREADTNPSLLLMLRRQQIPRVRPANKRNGKPKADAESEANLFSLQP